MNTPARTHSHLVTIVAATTMLGLLVAVIGTIIWLSIVPSPLTPKLPAGFKAITPAPPTDDLPVVEGANKLSVPGLRIQADISPQMVSQDSSGAILPPADPTLVATVRGGSSQNAAQGTWVLTGHVQTVDVAQGALWNLADAAPGELVATTGSDGEITWWQVTDLVTVRKDSFPFHRVDVSGPRYLWIVTCGGAGQLYNVIAIAQPIDGGTDEQEQIPR